MVQRVHLIFIVAKNWS